MFSAPSGSFSITQLPGRVRLDVVIADHPDIDLAALDVQLDDRRRLVLPVNKLNPLRELLIVVERSTPGADPPTLPD